MKRAAVIVAALLAASSAVAQLPGVPAVARPVPLVSCPFTPIGPSKTLFLPISGGNLSTDVNQVASKFSDGGLLRRMDITVDIAPGVGQSVTVTVQTGTCGTSLADSALSVVVSGTSTTQSNSTDTIRVSPGECVALRVTTSAAAALLTPTTRTSWL